MEQQHIIDVFGNRLRVRVCGVLVQENRILLIKHTNLGEAGYLWSPPGGGLHFGESITECLQREFLEETGLAIKIKDFLFVYEFLQKPLHAIELFFSVEQVGGTLKLGSDPEMCQEKQILQQIALVDDDFLRKENPACVHQAIWQAGSIENLLKYRGFMCKNSFRAKS
ncbi:MAG: NUDIX hydrolase [Raineya sp.]|nr:NUDIX hydrolase [Raineya sp.]MDW8297044.1 NUDIX hydrolase [Raineya sp.]